MAKYWVLSHGCRPADDWPDTFVPAGTTVHYYSEFDENTFRTNGLAAINAGDITANETFNAGAKITDYWLTPFDDAELAQHYASQSSRTGGELKAIGYGAGLGDSDGILLCTDPATCETTKPNHSAECNGLLKELAGNELFMVACRGLIGGDGGGTEAMGDDKVLNPEDDTERSYVMELNAKSQEILDWAQTDAQAALTYFRSLSQATQAQMVGSHTGLSSWIDEVNTQAESARTADVWLSDDLQKGLLGNARPKKFEKAWADDYWRNVFWQWFVGPGAATGQQEALLTVFDKLNAWYDSKDDDTARDLLDYCEGGSGVVPACDSGAVAALRQALDEESGVKQAVETLWDSVVGGLDMVYGGFYDDVGKLKDAIR
jgi:hypothetical protein